MMTKWRLSIAMIFGLLICGVGAGFSCKKAEQIHWKSNSTSGKRYKCLDCPDCPGGSQPSVPCGSSVPWGTPVECVFCQLGKTYSDKYDKAQCKACTVCSPGKAVIKNCTLSSNTVCDDKCAHGFYPMPFVFTCQPCEECCNDGKDEIAKECENYGRKCKLRSPPCIRVHTTPSKTTTVSRITFTAPPTTQPVTKEIELTTTWSTELVKQTALPTTQPFTSTEIVKKTTLPRTQAVMSTELVKKTALPTTQPVTKQIKLTTMSSTEIVKDTFPVPLSAGNNNRQVGSAKQNSENKTLIIVSTVSALIAVVVIMCLIAVLTCKGQITFNSFKCRCNKNSNNVHQMEVSQDKQTVLLQALMQQFAQALLPLSKLKSVSFDAYEKVWKRLDKQPEGTKKGDFRNVAEEFGYAQEDIWEFEKEFKTSGSGSPARQLLEALESRRPQLTVMEFINVLQKPNIERDDIVDILQEFILQRGTEICN